MRAGFVAGLALIVAGAHAKAATVAIQNADPVGQGLNDPTAFSPIGGNNASTLGAARLTVLNEAAAIWGAHLTSAVPIHVSVQMTPLSCSTNSAVLGSTGATTIHRDFPLAPRAATWYPQALANAVAGTDLGSVHAGDRGRRSTARSAAAGCLTGVTFYLGLDGHPGPNQVDLLTIALHEFSHGLGFQSYTDFSTGAERSGLSDAFLVNLQEAGVTPAALTAMSDAQREAAATSDPNLYWAGASVQAAASTLSAGLVAGHVRLYAPPTLAPGSSVAHYSTAATPNQLMEPFYTGPTRDLALTQALLRDIGWALAAQPVGCPRCRRGGRALLAFALLGAALVVVARSGRPRDGPTNSTPPPTAMARLDALTPRSPNQGARRAASVSGSAIESTASWPSSTPRLNETSAIGTCARGSAISRSAPAKPKPWMRPKGKVIRQRLLRVVDEEVLDADVGDRQRDGGLDEPGAGGEDRERRERQRERVGDVKAVTTPNSERRLPPTRIRPSKKTR